MKLLKIILVAALFFCFSLSTFANFTDVDESALYFKGIQYLEELGVVQGYDDGSFRPNEQVNRAEMLKIVLEAKGVPEAELAPYADDNCFEDVPANVWYTKYVCYAKAQGYVNGYEDGRFFHPDETINVVEALKITLKIWGIEYLETPLIWYMGVVNAAADRNYIPFNVVDFGANLQRGQMADMIARMANDTAGTLDIYLGPRSHIRANYDTIRNAMDANDWDIDPNHNALVLTTILTSQTDDEKVFTILDVPTLAANHASIANIPKTFMYAEGSYAYYYMTSAVCILDGSCSETQLAKIDDILTEGWLAAESFSLGEKDPQEGCYFVSPQDFQLTLPASWGLIHDFTIMDKKFWEDTFGYTDVDSYVGQGIVCDPDAEEPEGLDEDDPFYNDNPIILRAK